MVAARRARRYADAGADRVLDLCCGIGGDLLAFAGVGLRAHGVDRDPLTVEVEGEGERFSGAALRAFLFGVEPQDATTLACACAVLAMAALGAAYVPARRAADVDPIVTLRYE